MRTAAGFLLIALCLLEPRARAAGNTLEIQHGDAEYEQPIEYVWVVDNSGSMSERRKPGLPTKWNEMIARATEFLSIAPKSSSFWICIFEGDAARAVIREAKSDAERRDLKSWLENYAQPTTGGTALNATLARAFDEADLRSSISPGRPVTVCVFTDGMDEDPESVWSKGDALQRRFDALVLHNPNVSLSYMYLEQGFVPLIVKSRRIVPLDPGVPLPVNVKPDLTFINPAAVESQSGRIQFQLSDRVLAALRKQHNTTVRMTFSADAGSGLSFTPASWDYNLDGGAAATTLTLTPGMELKKNELIRGKIKLEWPKAAPYVCQGPDELDVIFTADERPEILECVPAPGQICSLEPIFFTGENRQRGGMDLGLRRWQDGHWPEPAPHVRRAREIHRRAHCSEQKTGAPGGGGVLHAVRRQAERQSSGTGLLRRAGKVLREDAGPVSARRRSAARVPMARRSLDEHWRRPRSGGVDPRFEKKARRSCA